MSHTLTKLSAKTRKKQAHNRLKLSFQKVQHSINGNFTGMMLPGGEGAEGSRVQLSQELMQDKFFEDRTKDCSSIQISLNTRDKFYTNITFTGYDYEKTMKKNITIEDIWQAATATYSMCCIVCV